MADGRVNNGGAREGAGRKRRPAYVPDGLLTPLDYLIGIMRDDGQTQAARIDVAHKVLPYTSARLLSADIQADSELHIYLVSQLADIPAQPDAA